MLQGNPSLAICTMKVVMSPRATLRQSSGIERLLASGRQPKTMPRLKYPDIDTYWHLIKNGDLIPDNVSVGEVTLNGSLPKQINGSTYYWETFIPSEGLSVLIEAVDQSGLMSRKSTRIERNHHS